MNFSRKWIKFTGIVATIACSALVVTSFQNCGYFKTAQIDDGSVDGYSNLPTPDCYFNGQFVAPRQAVTAFLNSTESSSCVSERRQCVSGSMSGSFAFATCAPGASASCLFDGRTIPNGGQVPAYQNSVSMEGSSCAGEMRTCNNGILSGTYNFNGCQAGGSAACIFDGQTIPHGDVVKAFESSSAPQGSNCASETRQCLNGRLSGSFSYSSCSVNEFKSCLFDGKTVSHGQRVIAFQASNGSCASEVRVCNEGVMTGTYLYGSCNANAQAACLMGGRTVAHGEYVVAYKDPYVTEGRSCSFENRLCVNGAFSGTYPNPTCVVMSSASEFSYQGNPYTLSMGFPQYIQPKLPTNFRGTCSVNPALPAGLSLDPATCAVTGAAFNLSNSQDFVVTAFSPSGSTSAKLSLSVLYPPASLTYPSSAYSFTKGVAINPIMGSNSGGSIVNCEISPSLPAGLSINSLSCMISGTPTSVIPTTSFAITTTNMSGLKSMVAINMTVRDVGPSFGYGSSSFNFNRGVAIVPLVAMVTGGAIQSCTVVPSLPVGLSFNTTNCTISGTPTVVTAQKNYAVAATNSGGTQSVVIAITVREVVPNLTYTDAPYSFVRGTAISALVPTNSGGPITGCSIAPALPSGIVMSTSTCAFSGTPLEAKATTNYTVTATNSIGPASFGVSITVRDMQPTVSYPNASYMFLKGRDIGTISISNSGGAITSCSISPTLAAGIVFNTTTCAFTGTPTAYSPAVAYVVTATNSGGSRTANITLSVADSAPTITFPQSSYTFDRDVQITPFGPTSSGGAIVTCESLTPLPAGLVINSANCEISGKPTEAKAQMNYQIKASNSGGTQTVPVSITVRDFAPNIKYDPAAYVLVKGVTINPIASINNPGGGVVTTCTISPGLSPGLRLELNNGACTILGTPTDAKVITDYIIVGKNATGESSFTVKLTINNP